MLDQELDTYWKTVVNTIHDGIMILNTQGIIVSVNRALEAITGYNRAELIGQPCTIFDCNSCKKIFDNHAASAGFASGTSTAAIRFSLSNRCMYSFSSCRERRADSSGNVFLREA